MVINTAGRGCRKLIDKTTTIADNEAIIQHLLNFAIFGIQLDPKAKFDEDALRLMKEMCRTGKFKFIVHTLSFTEEIDNFKKDYINNMRTQK